MRNRKPLAQRYVLHCGPAIDSPGPELAPGLSQGPATSEEEMGMIEGTK